MSRQITLDPLTGTFAVCRLDPGEPIPGWATDGNFICIARTPQELSIVCREDSVPDSVRCERGWKCFQLRGPFAFSEVGILAAVIAPLAKAGVSVFAVSTFDTDCVMVKAEAEPPARKTWEAAGHVIAPESQP